MSYLYVSEQGSVIGMDGNRVTVKNKEGILKSVPIEPLEVIEVFGRVQVTTPCIETCLMRGITILYYSLSGTYFGRLQSNQHMNVERQRLQAKLGTDETFKVAFSKRIIDAKIRNQIVVLRRYARNSAADMTLFIREMQSMLQNLSHAETVEQVMGYEGYAAKQYFSGLSELIDPDFAFKGRTRRPPTDPFNSLISLGYSIIMNEIYGKIEGKGLNPYFGFMHKDREKHPTLASDIMEEWRAVLIDTTAMSMLNGHELSQADFYRDNETGGIFLTKDAFKKYIAKLENKFRTANKYLPYTDEPVSFRKALDMQVNQFVKAVENENTELYQPVVIR